MTAIADTGGGIRPGMRLQWLGRIRSNFGPPLGLGARQHGGKFRWVFGVLSAAAFFCGPGRAAGEEYRLDGTVKLIRLSYSHLALMYSREGKGQAPRTASAHI
jgi:hypothetical protein